MLRLALSPRFMRCYSRLSRTDQQLCEAAGLSDEEIVRITDGPDAPGWDPFDAALLRAADELHEDQFLGDTTWKALSQRYSPQQYYCWRSMRH